jgi:Trypsin-co-occurring domain 2
MYVGVGMIELAEVIGELRRELQQAMTAGQGEPLRFELGPVELEATVAVEKGGGGGAKVRFWVIELGGDAKASQASTQRIRLALQPRLTSSGEKALIAGDEAPGER